MLPKSRSKLPARGDGGGICGGVGRLLLVRASCSNMAASSVGFFAPIPVAGLNCVFRRRCGHFSWLLEVAFWVNERSVVPGAICRDERDDRDCCGR